MFDRGQMAHVMSSIKIKSAFSVKFRVAHNERTQLKKLTRKLYNWSVQSIPYAAPRSQKAAKTHVLKK